jgi:hypothetical protein
MPLFETRDKEFYRHLVKNRVDPSAQSTSNPVPDYYGSSLVHLLPLPNTQNHRCAGEKIMSLHGYRQVCNVCSPQ